MLLGSAVRGTFGHSLKRLVCVDLNLECPSCPYRRTCNYIQIFEPNNPATNKDVPTGFVFETGFRSSKTIEAGGALRVGFTLFGAARRFLPYFVHLLREAGKRGMGADRVRFRLVEISARREHGPPLVLYEDGDEELTPVEASRVLLNGKAPRIPAGGEPGQARCRIRFETPCRLVADGRLVRNPAFREIARGLFRRLSTLAHYYGDEDLQIDYAAWLKLAERVRAAENRLRWFDWRRYSNRQETQMTLGGFTGEMVFEGPVRPFLPFLRACEVAHLGKNAGFGLGQYTLIWENE